MDANADITFDNGAILSVSGGTLSGSGNIIVNDTFNWDGGTISDLSGGIKKIITNGTSNLNSSEKYLDFRDWENNGNIIWKSGNINLSNAADIENGIGGIFEASDYSIFYTGELRSTFMNYNDFKKSGKELCDINIPFYNNGTVNINAGTLKLSRSSPINNSVINIATDAILEITEYDQLNISGRIEANGTLIVSLINEFKPEFGDKFEIINYTFNFGAFTTILPALPEQLMWDVNYEANSGRTISLNVVLKEENEAPILAPIGNKTVIAGELLQFTISASDPDGDPLTYSASNLPDGASFDSKTRTFTWSPVDTQAGTYNNIRFVVSDGSLIDSEEISITVNEMIPPVNEFVDSYYKY
ncbi:putative Ig domain-containing protein [Candidatus Poribacteria bacterium]|nr:putative Ig domain-containing protein [Candidatus Poribacteria bacterium]